MKIKNIMYPTPLSEIKDINNDNIDVCVELEDGRVYSVVVTTPQNIVWYMNKQKQNYVEASPPDIIVRSLTEENIRRALETYVEGDAYWLKLYCLAGEREGIFKVSNLDKLIDEINGY